MEALYAETVDKLPKLDSPALWTFLVGIGAVAIILLFIIKPALAFYKYIFLFMSVFYAAYLLTVTFSGDFNDVTGGVNTVLFDTINRYRFGTGQFFNNVVGNVLMMVPYGMFLGFFIHRGRIRPLRILWVLLLICLAPVLIELGQHVVGRVFDVDDVVLNIAGGLAGYLLYCILVWLYHLLPGGLQKNWFLNIMSIVLVMLLVVGVQFLETLTNQ